MKVFALFDGTRFYASSCNIYKPENRNRPTLVSAGQGISIAANRACSEVGISKFKPIWEQDALLRLHDGKIYRANFQTFGAISDRFMTCIEAQLNGSRIMRYSVDELFVDFTRLASINVNLDSLAQQVRKITYKETGVATGCGVSTTLTLTKAASWAAKNLDGYRGQCVMLDTDTVDLVLSQMPVGNLWNVGAAYRKHLENDGIRTAMQLKTCDPKAFQKKYSINIANVIHELNGVSVLNFDEVRVKKKQVWSTSSYRDRLKSLTDLSAEVSHHTAIVLKKLRLQRSEAMNLCLFLQSSAYDKSNPFNKSTSINFEFGLTDTRYALKAIRHALTKITPQCLLSQPIYKLGVGSTLLIDADVKQFDMFDDFDNQTKLNSTIDELNLRFGNGTVKFGSEHKNYQEQAGHVEVCDLDNYYSDVNQLLEVKCM